MIIRSGNNILFVISDRIREDCSRLFEDVVEDFCDTDIVKGKFESWKQKYRDTYQEAYIGLCLPKLFTPLVRLKLVDWIPFEVCLYQFQAKIF